ncbi:MAG: hypothetical protein IJX39_05635 [Clostridia bacterium]|nr:hypothetical protein [Clostridia bacterium]
MRLLFLGTGAAGSKNKPEAEIKEGQRRCSSMMIDHNILVDVAMQSFDYATKLGEDTGAITDIFLSHTHRDHYVKETLLAYAAAAGQKINFWCHEGAVADLGLSDQEAALINICPVKCMQKWETAGMTVTALPANHLAGGPRQQPLHYIFEKDGKTLFYGCDGGWFRADTWEYLRAKNVVFNAMILEATVGELPGNFRIGTHNTVPMLRLLLEALRENAMLPRDAIRIADHLGVPPYDTVQKDDYGLLTELGMTVAYDGLVMEI